MTRTPSPKTAPTASMNARSAPPTAPYSLALYTAVEMGLKMSRRPVMEEGSSRANALQIRAHVPCVTLSVIS